MTLYLVFDIIILWLYNFLWEVIVMNDTILAALVSGIFNLIAGFIGGYQYSLHINVKKKQIQKSRDNSLQVQIGDINERK